MKRISRTGAALVACTVAVGLVACGAPSTGGGGSGAKNVDFDKIDYNGTVSIITKFSDPSTAKFFPEMASEFEAQHPGVKIDVQQESDQGYKDKIKVLASSGSIPDIYFTWAGQTAKQYVDAGLALDITSQIGPGTEWNSSLVSSAVEAGRFDGKNYGIPIDLDAKFMVYNKKIFADSGIAVPTSISDLLSACQTLKSKGMKNPIAFGNKYGWPAILYLTQLNAYDVPEDTRTKDYGSAGDGLFTDAGYVQALDQLTSMLDQCTSNGTGANGIDHNDQLAAFGAGDSAMMYLEWVEFGLLAGTKAEKDGWGFFQLPTPPDPKGSATTIAGSPDLFLINAKAKNPALAVAFMKFVISKEGAAKMPTLMIGYPSAVKGTIDESNATPQSVEALKAVDSASGLAIWLDQVTRPTVSAAYLAAVEAMLSGSKSSSQVMQSIQEAAASPENR